MPSILDTALRYMQGTRKREVTQKELLDIVSRKTGCSRESVRGTIIGDACGRKLFGKPQFKKHWVVCLADKTRGKKKRFVRRPYLTDADMEANVNYDTPEKEAARERGLSYLQAGAKQVITLAAEDGHCVMSIRQRCPKAQITNIERDSVVLAAWQEKGIPTVDRLCHLSDFIRSKEFLANRYDFFNMDLMGYACPSLGEDLIHLNKTANVETIVLNIAGARRFRNTGPRFERMKRKYRSDDPICEWVRDMMPD